MGVGIEVVHGVCVGVDDPVYVLRADSFLHPGGCARNEALSVELVGVEQVTAEGFSIVGFIGDVCENEDTRFLGEGLEAGD